MMSSERQLGERLIGKLLDLKYAYCAMKQIVEYKNDPGNGDC